ncbi:transporter substrate-binding domain-containing protein [Desulforhopalus sp. IMCC35007]|uniref:transporter substrate-binding domain-containing protein n=1 Tax=Desulforhopalus sp. IMCC35007 TaxID=2569543 RepID=UPI0010AE0D0D|nr:transporter substrate-binding domain-containing protein [Desulforhopalus sp. IMCC35007]TKB06142.1 transporter substrate-binding domain-containing protein [Desulforhopalus sp. IMCC35007]
MKKINSFFDVGLLLQIIICALLFQSTAIDVTEALGQEEKNGVALSPEEISWLKAHPVIRLAPDPHFQPIEFFDSNGLYAGIGADYTQLITQKLGISFEVVKCNSWDDVVKRIKNHDVDVLNAVVRTPERETYLDFPPPYLTIPSVIIVRNSVSDELTLDSLKGMRVAMVRGYGYVDLVRQNYPDLEIDLVSNLKTALRKVSFGMADAFVGDLATASHTLEAEGITNLKLAGETHPPNVSGFAVRSDWPELSGILQKAQALLTEDERNTIRNKWIHLQLAPGISKEKLRNLIAIVSAVVLVIVCSFLLWTRMLNRVVRTRTNALFQEIEERKRAEQALKESEKKFRVMVEISPLAIYMFEGIEQKAVYINSTFTKLFGYTMADVLDVNQLWPLAYPDEKYRTEVMEEWQKKVIHAIHTKTAIEPMETVVICKDGSRKNISWGFIATGEQHWAFGLDLTEIKEAEEKKIALDAKMNQFHKIEAIGQLAGGIAHDFNNILGVIIGYAEMIQADSRTGSTVRADIDEVINASRRAKELIKQILDFSRQSVPECICFQPVQVVKETLKMIRSSLPATIEIRQDIDSQTGMILADPTQIHQILMNLATNAYHAMGDSGGILTVSLKNVVFSAEDLTAQPDVKSGDFIELAVADNGSGIAPEIQNKIFDPYFTTKEMGRGCGMGLSIIHGIVKKYRGFVSCESKEGEGSVFRVLIPVDAEARSHESQPAGEPDRQGGNERILFVDDEELLVEIGKIILEQSGYELFCKTSSLDALDAFQTDPYRFDLVITDQTMPGLTGLELSRRIRKIRSDIPIVLCSGFISQLEEEEAKVCGINAFAMKPIEREVLTDLVRKVLNEEKKDC